MKKKSPSIFRKFFSTDDDFVDCFKSDKKNATDVIIPVVHTNELWIKNILSIYREIPVNRLLISDGGCIDNSIKIVKQFPRVKVLNHRKFNSLGYCIRKLIEEVETDWFVYLHSDVYLPRGWFKTMKGNQNKYDWFECRQHITALIEYPLDYTGYNRPLSGSQMGRKEIFKDFLPKIEDDYLYRNEDLIFADLVRRHGGRYGRVEETFHYHQLMNTRSKWQRKIRSISVDIEKNNAEKEREFNMQVRGLIKYARPDQNSVQSMQGALDEILRSKSTFNSNGFKQWAKKTNPIWLPYIAETIRKRRRDWLSRLYRFVVRQK